MSVAQDSPSKPLLDRMVTARQLSSLDAKTLSRHVPPVQTEAEVLTWLAKEYDLSYTALDDIEPDREFPQVIHLVGIESPGLTAAPAIAQHVSQLVAAFLG